MMRAYKILLILLVALTGCNTRCNTRQATSNEITGKIIKIMDGDTYELLLEDNSTIRVRMDGIDAPEKGMPFSKKAKNYLTTLCKDQTITVEKTNEDRYGRILGFTFLEDGRELSREMLKAGYAWHYKKYNSDPDLAALENEAREAKRGLWQDKNPMTPWENRKLHRQGISTKEMYKSSTDEDINN
jgi:endonuclease YncB( thermonuclease family)